MSIRATASRAGDVWKTSRRSGCRDGEENALTYESLRLDLPFLQHRANVACSNVQSNLLLLCKKAAAASSIGTEVISQSGEEQEYRPLCESGRCSTVKRIRSPSAVFVPSVYQ